MELLVLPCFKAFGIEAVGDLGKGQPFLLHEASIAYGLGVGGDGISFVLLLALATAVVCHVGSGAKHDAALATAARAALVRMLIFAVGNGHKDGEGEFVEVGDVAGN